MSILASYFCDRVNGSGECKEDCVGLISLYVPSVEILQATTELVSKNILHNFIIL